MNHKRGKADGAGSGFIVEPIERDEEDGAVGLAQVVVGDIGDDTDNLVHGLIGAALKGAADGVLSGEEGFDEGLVDDGGSGRSIFRAKVAAG